MAKSDNILTKLQDLLVSLIPQLNRFPKTYFFPPGGKSRVSDPASASG
jgi:hypothetical protein